MSAVTSLSRNDPTVDPGGQAAVTVKVRNAGSIVDRFDVDVVGPSVGWVRVDPPSLSLFPGVEGTVTITWEPPRASNPRAGTYPFGIRVRPAADPAGSTVEEGRISVTPFTNVAADIVPVTSRGSKVGKHQVIVANRGNASSEVAVTAEDPDARLKLAVQPPRAVVAPDAKVGFGIRVEVDDPFPFGPEKQRPFQVSVAAGRQTPIALRGTMTQRPGLPGWIPPVAGIVGLVALLAIGAFVFKAGPFAPEATPSPSIAQASVPPSGAASLPASQPPSAPASVAASAPASVAASQPPTPPPSPTAPQNEIRFAGMELEDADLRPEPNLARREPLITFTTDGPGDVTLEHDQERRQQRRPGPALPCPRRRRPGVPGPGRPGRGHRPQRGGRDAILDGVRPPDRRQQRAVRRPDADVLRQRALGDLHRQRHAERRCHERNAGRERLQRDRPRAGHGEPPGDPHEFQEQPANFAWGQWVVGQPEPPLTQEVGVATKDVGPINLQPGSFVQYRFVGQSTFDGSPVTYSVRFNW